MEQCRAVLHRSLWRHLGDVVDTDRTEMGVLVEGGQWPWPAGVVDTDRAEKGVLVGWGQWPWPAGSDWCLGRAVCSGAFASKWSWGAEGVCLTARKVGVGYPELAVALSWGPDPIICRVQGP